VAGGLLILTGIAVAEVPVARHREGVGQRASKPERPDGVP